MQSPTLSRQVLAGRRIAVVAARWHAELVDRSVTSFRDAATVSGAQVEVVHVPGAFEIPLRAQQLARSGEYDAIACCALVVDGGIYRHDFVAATVVDALMRVQLDTGVPVFSAVLTPHHFHEHADHVAFFGGHLAGKGTELAAAVAGTLALPA